ncbi:unnamed protein product [Boreogadus saida]
MALSDGNIVESRSLKTLRMSGMESGSFLLRKLFATKTSSGTSCGPSLVLLLEAASDSSSVSSLKGWA